MTTTDTRPSRWTRPCTSGVRLGILAVLSEATECTFAVLRDELDLTDGNLNRHLHVLEEAGLLEVRKATRGAVRVPGCD